jgi:hypothetical protein
MRGLTYVIGLETPPIVVFTRMIKTPTCLIVNGKLTPTWNSFKSLFVMMILHISSHLSLSRRQFYHHLIIHSEVCLLYRSIPWSWVNTKYSIHSVPHHHMIDCLPLPVSLSSLSRPCCTKLSRLPQCQVNQCIEFQLLSHLSLELRPWDLPLSESPPADWLPPTTPPMSANHGGQVHLETCSIPPS